MKTKVLIQLLIICSFISCSDSKLKWDYQDDLELAEIYINQVLEINDTNKFLGIFKKVGKRIELVDMGDIRLVASIDLSEIDPIIKDDKKIIINCPEPHIKSHCEYIGFDTMALVWECIDTLEGRIPYTEAERKSFVDKAMDKLNNELRENEELRYDLLKTAKASARTNLPVFFKRCNPSYEEYSIKVVFKSDKDTKQETQDTK